MSSPPEPPSVPKPTPSGRKHPLRDLILFVVLLLVVGGGILGYVTFTSYRSVVPVDFARSIRAGVVNPEKLDPAFTDADNDLVADPPTNRSKLQDPPTLIFGTLGQSHGEWKEFRAHLASVTGKKIEMIETPWGGQDVVKEMKAGKLHVAALSTGTVPLAVNRGGFVPCCVMADENRNFAYQMEILVGVDSPMKSLADLKGKTLTLTSMASLSSFKAPVVVLWKEAGLKPDVDYQIKIAASQRAAIQALSKGRDEVIAVANDFLARVVRDEKIDPKSLRTIYKSESYPPACFGHTHDLEPALAKKVRQAFTSFTWKGTALEKAYRPANQSRFVPIDYKKDWGAVRAVDRAILELVGGS